MDKIIDITVLPRLISDIRKEDKKIVFTNGCFDLIHAGHIRYLKEAKAFGDVLIVGLNSDDSIKAFKSVKRPIIPQNERAEVLSGIKYIDYIIIFNEETPVRLIEIIKPDIIVKGGDYKSDGDVVGGDIVVSYKGKIKRASLAEGISTTDIIEKILRLYR